MSEPVFDSRGWCWDMRLAPEREDLLLRIKMPMGDRETVVGYLRPRGGWEVYDRRRLDQSPYAWRPLPLTPEGET
jgi:hypothetical protein